MGRDAEQEVGGRARLAPREALRKKLLAIYDSKEKIPYADAKGKWLYNFWRDEQHERGLWRRISV